jgi:hypothetical protein
MNRGKWHSLERSTGTPHAFDTFRAPLVNADGGTTRVSPKCGNAIAVPRVTRRLFRCRAGCGEWNFQPKRLQPLHRKQHLIQTDDDSAISRPGNARC